MWQIKEIIFFHLYDPVTHYHNGSFLPAVLSNIIPDLVSLSPWKETET